MSTIIVDNLKTALENNEVFQLAEGKIDTQREKKVEMMYRRCIVTFEFVVTQVGNIKLWVSTRIQTNANFAASTTIGQLIKKRSITTNNVDRIVNHIIRIYEKLLPKMEEFSDKVDKDEERKNKKQQILQSSVSTISDNMEVEDDYVRYRMSKNYTLLCNTYVKNDVVQYNNPVLYGSFSAEQIKRLVDFLTTCPEAVEDRLLNGK